MSGLLKTTNTGGRPTLAGQPHEFRESWLAAATEAFRPVFKEKGHPLPDNIRFSIAFTSKGMRSNRIGEHWPAVLSTDGFNTIIIRADLSDPLEVLGVLAHELCHAAAPPDAKHGREFRRVAEAMGLVGKMLHASPGPELNDWLRSVISSLGPLPHSRLIFGGNKKKTTTKGSKTRGCHCDMCDYVARVPLTCIEVAGPPLCPVDNMPMSVGRRGKEDSDKF
jgi:hypothetical protein